MQPQQESKPVCLEKEGRAFIELLGKSHVLDMLYLLAQNDEALLFNQLKRELAITATTLSRRLDDFLDQGLVIRKVFAEVPARVEYQLSDKGRSLGPILRSVFGWVKLANSKTS